MVQIFWHSLMNTAGSETQRSSVKYYCSDSLSDFRLWKLTRLGREDAHEAREEGVDGPQDFGVAAGHARSDAPLEWLEVSQDGRGLQDGQQEAQDLQSGADVGDVGLCWLFLRGYRRNSETGR